MSYDVIHLFFIPLIPLGKKVTWNCTLCGNDPRYVSRTGVLLKILGLVLLTPCFALGAALAEYHYLLSWLVRTVVILAAAGLLYSICKPARDPRNDERRKMVIPSDNATCFYCHGHLVQQPDLHCPTCQVRVYTD